MLQSVKEQKKELRKAIIEAEKRLDDGYRASSSASICAGLAALPEYKSAKTVLAFMSMKREPDLSAFLEGVLASGRTLCVPLCRDGGLMEFKEINGPEDLGTGRYGLREPKESCRTVPAEDIDLAVVPCVSCSRDGKRLGNGGGYYDRFLEGFGGSAAMICRERLLSEHVPTEAFDVAVPLVVTEDAVYRNGLRS